VLRATGHRCSGAAVAGSLLLAGELTYLTHTRLRGRTVMRVGFGHVLTAERHLGILWARVLAERNRLTG